MATNAAAGAPKQLASAAKATSYTKKYTVRSTGIWDRIRRALAIDPDRSSGIPLNPQYRNPPPGANPPEAYDDPVTVPAGDIAENPYYRRDIRRAYPRLSVVNQADVVALLSVGSAAKPKEDVLQIGDAGAKQLVEVKQEGEEKGLAALFEKDSKSVSSIFGPNGLPPFPTGGSRLSPEGGRKYVMDRDGYEGYPPDCTLHDYKDNIQFRSYMTIMKAVMESIMTMFRKWKDLNLPSHEPGSRRALGIEPQVLLSLALDMQEAAGQNAISPLDIIFSCCICQDTPSSIYKEPDDRLPLRQSENTDFGRIAKLYLTACAHVICTKHFDGGGVPFHPMGQRPKAPCPFCRQINAGDQPQELFAVQGPAEGEHDPGIPQRYFETAPAKLSEPEMEALRFQYVSMLRYGSAMYLKKVLVEDRAAREKAKHEKLIAELRKLLDQQESPAWTERARKIKLLGTMVKSLQAQLKRARGLLHQLGQDVTSIDEALLYQNINVFEEEDGRLDVQDVNPAREQQRTASSANRALGEVRLAQGSAADLANMNRAANTMGARTSGQPSDTSQAEDLGAERPAKRKRGDSPKKPHEQAYDEHAGNGERMSSRDAMPPPQLPMHNVTTAQTPQPNRGMNAASSDRSNTLHRTSRAPRPFYEYAVNAAPFGVVPDRHRMPSSPLAPLQGFPSDRNPVSNDSSHQSAGLVFDDDYPSGERGVAQRIPTLPYDQSTPHEAQPIAIPGRNGPISYRFPEDPLNEAQEQMMVGNLQRSMRYINQPLPNFYSSSSASGLSQPESQNQPHSPWARNPIRAGTGHNHSLVDRWLLASNSPYSNGRMQPFELSPYSFDQSVPYSTTDGELDRLAQFTPQTAIRRSASVTPSRSRLTLPPTPRNTNALNTLTQSGTGLLNHVRSSSASATVATPRSDASHRQQLGLPSTTGPLVSQSPFPFQQRINPQHQLAPIQRPHSVVPAASTPVTTLGNTGSPFRTPQPSHQAAPVANSPYFTGRFLSRRSLLSSQLKEHQQSHLPHGPGLQPLGQPNNQDNRSSITATTSLPGEDLGSRYMTATGIAGQARQPSARMDPQVLNGLSFLNEPTVEDGSIAGRRKARR